MVDYIVSNITYGEVEQFVSELKDKGVMINNIRFERMGDGVHMVVE
jgi:hypothetical protein